MNQVKILGLFITAAFIFNGCGYAGFAGASSHQKRPEVQSNDPVPGTDPNDSDRVSDPDVDGPAIDQDADDEDQIELGESEIGARPGVEIIEGELVINIKISRIEVDVTLDHVTDLVITNRKVFFIHRHLGFPDVTNLRFYNAAGQLIDTKNYRPRFKVGVGANCANTGYLTKPGECRSLSVRLKLGHTLKGRLTKKIGRGYVGIRTIDKSHVISAFDCGADCNSPAGGNDLSGAARYSWEVF